MTEAPPLRLPVPLSRGFRPSAWLTLFRISVAQFVRGKRLLVLALMFALPTVLALVVRYNGKELPAHAKQAEIALVFYMLPQALVPLCALILASGMIRDEVEGQTITYLLIRPLPRPSIYLAKLLAAWSVSVLLTLVFTSTLLGVIYWGDPGLWGAVLPLHAMRVTALSALALLVYTAIFGGLSLIVRWVLPFGVAYIVFFEGVCANIDFAVRKLTVLWYVRILAERWLDIHVDSWNIDLKLAPSGQEAFLTLLASATVLAISAAWLFGRRELRVKTPEGA